MWVGACCRPARSCRAVFWHSEERQGVDRDTYIKARTAEHASVKVRALFVWESEVKVDPDSVRSRLEGFSWANGPSH